MLHRLALTLVLSHRERKESIVACGGWPPYGNIPAQGTLDGGGSAGNIHRTEKVNFAARKGNQFWLV